MDTQPRPEHLVQIEQKFVDDEIIRIVSRI